MTERTRDERIESYYHQSAWDLAESLVDAEDENARLKAKVEERDGLLERGHELYLMFRRLRDEEHDRAERLRLAWLSARRRAADEANFAMEGMDLLRAQAAYGEDSLRRARAFVDEVAQVRGWTMCADTPHDLLESHLRPVYDSLYELEEAEREGRPFRPRWVRTGYQSMTDQCPKCDTIQDSIPQPAPCTCGDEVATVAYWRAEHERAFQEETRQSTSAPRLVQMGTEEDGGTVWRLEGSSVPDVDVAVRERS